VAEGAGAGPAAWPVTPAGDGVRLAVRLMPRAGRSGLDGVGVDAGGRAVLRLRVSAPPVDGAANAALAALVATALAIRPKDVRIVSGETGRLKILHLGGDALDLERRIRGWIDAAAAG
jgi:uncharacterized protein YggU (UPF0235/DUF167 family)